MTTFVRDCHGFTISSLYKSRSLICPDTMERSPVLKHDSYIQTVGGTYIPRRIRARLVEQEEGGKARECPRNRTPADTYGMDQKHGCQKRQKICRIPSSRRPRTHAEERSGSRRAHVHVLSATPVTPSFTLRLLAAQSPFSQKWLCKVASVASQFIRKMQHKL